MSLYVTLCHFCRAHTTTSGRPKTPPTRVTGPRGVFGRPGLLCILWPYQHILFIFHTFTCIYDFWLVHDCNFCVLHQKSTILSHVDASEREYVGVSCNSSGRCTVAEIHAVLWTCFQKYAVSPDRCVQMRKYTRELHFQRVAMSKWTRNADSDLGNELGTIRITIIPV